MANIIKVWISGLLVVLLVIQGFSFAEFIPAQMQKVYADTILPGRTTGALRSSASHLTKVSTDNVLNAGNSPDEFSNTQASAIEDNSSSITQEASSGISGTDTLNFAATPVFSPAAGTYTASQTVSITCATTGASIYYTTDGTEPTADSTVYSSPLDISETATIKAIAVKEGITSSEIASAQYIIQEGSGTGTDGKEVNLHLWSYKLVGDSTYSLYAYKGNFTDGKIEGCIPAEINGKPVKGLIGTFNYCTLLTQAPELPQGITDMSNAFSGCTGLKQAPAIPDTVTNMSSTFQGCVSLTSAPKLPDNLTDMKYAFSKCTSLTQAPAIPDRVTNLNSTFLGCTSLVQVSEIPDGIASLNSTFSKCSSLTQAPVIPDSVTIMSGTFSKCSSLIKVPSIPNGVKILTNTFTGCTSLTGDVLIPASVDSLYGILDNTSQPINMIYSLSNTAAEAYSPPANVTRVIDSTSPVISGVTGTTSSGIYINATDNYLVSGYAVTASPAAPISGWQSSNTFLDLFNGIYYAWAIDAVGNISQGTKFLYDGGKMAPPENLTATPSSISVRLSWNAVYGATGYEIYRDDEKAGTAYTNSFRDSGLVPGKTYLYNVKAFNASGDFSALSEALTVTTNSILAPSNISVTATDTTLTVDWDAAATAQSCDVSIDGNIANVKKDKQYTVVNLQPNTLHKIKVRTYNSSGSYGLIGDINGDGDINVIDFAQLGSYLKLHEGEPSEEELLTSDLNGDGAIDALDYSLMKIYLFNSSRCFPKSISVWSDEIEKYTLLPAPVNLTATPSSISMELTWDAVEGATGYDVEVYGNAVDIGNSTSYIHTGLETNSQRTYRVRAKNSNSVSEWSDLVAATTLPGTAFNLQTRASDNSIKVSWNAQAGATAYEIEIDGLQTIELTDKSYLHEGLITNSQHNYRVRSKNKDGVSGWSETVTGVVLPSVPDNLHVTTVSGSAIEVGWNEVTGATGYDIEVDGRVIDNALNNTYSHMGLNTNEEHTYRVRAKNGTVAGEWSQEIRKITLLPAPENLKAAASGNQIQLEWDMVAGAEYYEVEIDGKILKADAAAEYLHSDITAGKVYTYRVRAVNSNGYGEWSDAVNRAGLLGIPSNIIWVSQSNSIKIFWNEVSGAASYDVMLDGKIVNNIEGTSYEWSGLAPNSRHIFRVRAVNEGCTGEWSSLQSTDTRVGVPSGIKISATGTEITVTWDEVDGADSYDVSVDGSIINNGTNTAYKHTGLSCNSEHSYKVRAKNNSGEGLWSTDITQFTGPLMPLNLKGEAGINQIELTWDKPEGSVSYELEADGKILKDIQAEGYTDQSLEPNTRHEYRLRAKNNKGIYSEWSEILEINTTEELTVKVEKDLGFNFVIAVPKKEGIDSYDIVVSYDAADVEVLDLYAGTQKAELEPGKIEGTSITVKQFSQGKIVYGVEGADKPVMAIIRFISKTNSQTKMSYVVE